MKTPWRISGIAGILFVSLSFIALGMNVLPPEYNQDKATLLTWFAVNSQWYRIGHLIAGLAFLLFYFPFFSGFCERLREAEGTPAIWSRVAWAGAIISPAAGTTAGALFMGVTLLGANASPEVLQFGTAANFYAYVVSGAYGGVVMLGAAIVIIRTGIFRRWLGWAGLLIGFAAISGTGALVENNPKGLFANINGIAWLAYFLWIAFISFELIRIPSISIKE